jgi:hypothetical protein
LAEVFGFPTDNLSPEAERYRLNKLCPYNNKAPSCTKDKVKDPLGVCSVFEGDALAITCPIRFREAWYVIEDAARFFFPASTSWTSLQEIRLNDANGESAGNIDFVLVAYDSKGRVTDFGALEVQAVYISGNVRRPFECYMEDRSGCKDMTWTETNVKPDYLSSSRKRLVPQLIYKGSILKAWNKKQAVAIHEGFFRTLPELPVVEPEKSDIAWLVYGLEMDADAHRYRLARRKTEFTTFKAAIEKMTLPAVGPIEKFVQVLQQRLDMKLSDGHAPDAPLLGDVLSE